MCMHASCKWGCVRVVDVCVCARTSISVFVCMCVMREEACGVCECVYGVCVRRCVCVCVCVYMCVCECLCICVCEYAR